MTNINANSSGTTEEFSSEDSNIVTMFQSFETSPFIISPSQDLSQTFAKIELIIKEPIQFEDLGHVSVDIGEVYNLILHSISLVESCNRIVGYFQDYYKRKIGSIINRIFTPQLFNVLYSMNDKNIDIFWQIDRFVSLLYTFDLRAIIPDLDNNTTFKIPTKSTITILKCLELPIYKYLSTEEDAKVGCVLTGDSCHPNEFFRGKVQHSYVILEKLDHLQHGLTIVLVNCRLDRALLDYFENTTKNPPVYFSYTMFAHHCATIVQKATSTGTTKYSSIVRSIFESVEKALTQRDILRATTQTSGSTVMQRYGRDKGVDSHNYQYHVNKYKAGIPDWSQFFHLDRVGTESEGSEASKSASPKSPKIPKIPEIPQISESPETPETFVSVPTVKSIRGRDRFKNKLKQAFGIYEKKSRLFF